jgi:hypothetical protein
MSAPVTRAEYEALLKRVGALQGNQNMYAVRGIGRGLRNNAWRDDPERHPLPLDRHCAGAITLAAFCGVSPSDRY